MATNHSRTSSKAPARLRRASGLVGVLGMLTIGTTALFPAPGAGAAQAPVGLGTATSFAVLAGQGITNANATTIIGDTGSYPNPAETGFDTVTQIGTDHGGDAVTAQAKDDLTTAYNQAAGAGPPTAVAVELGGTTLTPGVYNGDTLQITGTLTLDTGGDPNAVFIFQTGSTLITGSNSAVVVLNGGIACNVFWQVPSSATLGTGSHLIGTVLASTSIQAASRATVQGRLLASTGSVTLDENTISTAGCDTGTTAPGGTTDTTAPGGTTDTTAPGGTTDTTTPGGTTDTSAPGGTTDTTAPGGTTDTATPGGTTDTATPGGTTDTAATGGTTDTAATGGTTGTLAGPGTPTTAPRATTTPAISRSLPRTGLDTGSLVLVAGLLLALGSGLRNVSTVSRRLSDQRS